MFARRANLWRTSSMANWSAWVSTPVASSVLEVTPVVSIVVRNKYSLMIPKCFVQFGLIFSGCRGGIFTLLEKKWGHKCEWVCCQLHIAELILRKLIEELDGVTTSPNTR